MTAQSNKFKIEQKNFQKAYAKFLKRINLHMEMFNFEQVLPNSKDAMSEFILEVGAHQVKVFIVIERRRGSRVSFTKKGVVIRLHQLLTHAQKQEQTKAFIAWAKNKVIKHPELITQYSPSKNYREGELLQLYGETFLIKTFTDKSKFATVKVREGELILVFPETLKPERRAKVASRLVAKIMANYFQPKVHRRILELNTLYFQKKITKVTLKNNSSNWGSCSIRSNINISTRLLFAPEYVIDYVYIHELTHLVHMDHSERFWTHVEGIMPSYQNAEKWLKVNGGKCLF